MVDHSIISTEPGPISPSRASQSTFRSNQCLLGFTFGISLIVPLFLFGAGRGSAQTVNPVPVPGTCAAFAEEILKGLPTTDGCETGPPVDGRCPGNAGQTAVTLFMNASPPEPEVVTSGPPAVCVKTTIAPSVLTDSKMFVWVTSTVPASKACLKANQAYEEHTEAHEKHHVDDAKTVLSKYLKQNSGSLELVGCGANREDALKKLKELVDAEEQKIWDMLAEASNRFHQTPEGAAPAAPFFEDVNPQDGRPDLHDGKARIDCRLCPALPPDSKGWCTTRKKPLPEKCGFSTATQACKEQYDSFIEDQKSILFNGSEPSTQWNISQCLWARAPDNPDHSGFSHPTDVQFKCSSGTPSATVPWSCQP
jgi:hypothetical protein